MAQHAALATAQEQTGRPARRVRTPTLLQMEAVECGAACLGILLAHHGRVVPLEELRVACGVNRDGSSAKSVLDAGKRYGLVGRGFRMELTDLFALPTPSIVYWAFQHFLVLEGTSRRWGRRRVHVNDPATGPRTMELSDFDSGYTGVVLTLVPGENFRSGGRRPSMWAGLRERWGRSHGLLPLALLASLLLIVPGLVAPAFTRIFIDNTLAGSDTHLGGLLFAMALSSAVLVVLTEIQQRSFTTLYGKLALTSTPAFFRHLLRLPVNFFLQRQPAELARRIRSNTTIADLLSRDIATTAVSLVLVVFYAGLMLSYDVNLSLIGVGMAVLNLGVLRWVSRVRTDAVARLQADRGRLQSVTISTLAMIETVKATGMEADSFARWSGYHGKVANLQQRLGIPTSVLTAAPPMLAMVNSGAILLVGGLKAINGSISIGLLVAFQALLAGLSRPVGQLTNLGERLQDLTADVDRIRDVMNQQPDPQLADQDQDGTCTAATDPDQADEPARSGLLAGHLLIRDLTVRYGPLAPPALSGFDLVMPPGFRVAVVGGSGSGKSTVARAVAGIYPHQTGDVLFDGKPRSAHSRLTLSTSIAVVDQDLFLFEGTIRDNLTLWDDTVPTEDIVAALRDAELYDVVGRRPGGIDSPVAERAANFSGGQRQRLAIARALVRNPTVLILDEATSALDGETERRVVDNIRRRGCSCLIIAHRLSTIRDCDEIVVLAAGRVVERGQHRTLMDLGGEYHRLVTAA